MLDADLAGAAADCSVDSPVAQARLRSLILEQTHSSASRNLAAVVPPGPGDSFARSRELQETAVAPVLEPVARAGTDHVPMKIAVRKGSLAVDRRHGAPAVPARMQSGNAEVVAKPVCGHSPQDSRIAADKRCVAALMAVGPAEDSYKAESWERARIAERAPYRWSRTLRHWELPILATRC